MLIEWVLMAGFMLAIGQDSPHHEPIHPDDRVFTAEEFRQHLQWIRGQQKILDAVQNMKISPENQKKMADFAQRLLDQSQKPGAKQDLPIPESLTKDPSMEKLLHDEKFLEWLANNERMQKMAERLASKFNLPKPQQPVTPPSNIPGFDPARGTNPSGRDAARSTENAQKQQPNRRTIQSKQQSQNRSASSPSSNPRSSGIGPSKNNNDGGNHPGSPSSDDGFQSNERDGSNGSPAEQTARADNGMTQGSDIDPSRHSVLRQMTDAMRRVGPLQNSPTLDRVDDLMGKEPIVPDRIAMPPASAVNNHWFEQTLKSEWLDSPWVTNLPKSLENIPLPTGWESSAIPLDKIPIPGFPRTEWVLPTSGMPPVPGVNLSMGKGLSLNGWSAPFLLLVIVVALFLLRSYLTGELGLSVGKQVHAFTKSKPAAPFDPHQRDSIRQWFEYLVLSRFGQAARPRTHAQLARSLSAGSLDAQVSAQRLAELYAEARYLPPQDDLDEDLTRHAKEDLARFTAAKSIDSIKPSE